MGNDQFKMEGPSSNLFSSNIENNTAGYMAGTAGSANPRLMANNMRYGFRSAL